MTVLKNYLNNCPLWSLRGLFSITVIQSLKILIDIGVILENLGCNTSTTNLISYFSAVEPISAAWDPSTQVLLAICFKMIDIISGKLNVCVCVCVFPAIVLQFTFNPALICLHVCARGTCVPWEATVSVKGSWLFVRDLLLWMSRESCFWGILFFNFCSIFQCMWWDKADCVTSGRIQEGKIFCCLF